MIMMSKVGNLLELIEDEKLDGIMNAANGIGPMGAGIAGAIRRAGGTSIQQDAFKVCSQQDPQEGQAYSTIAGALEQRGIKRIIHAVTMKRPGSRTSYEIVERAFKSAIELATKENITRLGCTALGTGVGGLDSKVVASIMGQIANLEHVLNIIFIDFDNNFIQTIKDMK